MLDHRLRGRGAPAAEQFEPERVEVRELPFAVSLFEVRVVLRLDRDERIEVPIIEFASAQRDDAKPVGGEFETT